MDNTNQNLLRSLKDSDFEIADNEPNVLGWSVKDQQGRKIGEVEDLIFDPQSRRVRYLVLDLEGNVLDLEPREVLIPIGMAELHTSDDDVMLPGVSAEQLRALPKYENSRLNREQEAAVIAVFNGNPAAGGDFYGAQHFDEDNAFRNRQQNTGQTVPVIEEQMQVGKKTVESGSTHLRTRIVEKPVEKNVTLKEEHVTVERNPTNRPVTDKDLNAFKEGTVEIKEHAEIPVVGKEARVVEEINLKKEVSEHDQTVRGTVRNTEVKVEQQDLNRPQNPNTNNPNQPNPNPGNPNR